MVDFVASYYFPFLEPGYYEEGKFGIRIESLHIIVRADTENHFNKLQFNKFENITWVGCSD